MQSLFKPGIPRMQTEHNPAEIVMESEDFCAEPPVPVPDYAPESLCGMLDRMARTYAWRTAIIFRGRKITYEQMLDTVERMAATLRIAGLHPGDRVAIILPNLPQAVLAFWAVIKAGGVVVMTNPLYMEKELLHQLTDSGAKFVIALDMLWPRLNALRDQLPVEIYYITRVSDALPFPVSKLYNFQAACKKTLVDVPFDGKTVCAWNALVSSRVRYVHRAGDPAATLAALQYTGGTTGVSKGVMLTHHNLNINTEQLKRALDIQASEPHSILAVLPFFHVYGLTTCLLLSVALGAPTILIPRYAPMEVLEVIKNLKPTLFPGAPSIYISLMQQKSMGDYDFSSIRFCVSGSAPMPVDKFEEFTRLSSATIVEGYGLTEASPVTHLNPIGGRSRNGSIGLPLPYTEARIVDMEVGTVPVPVGVPGELVIRGPQVMPGYWNKADETASALRNGWLYTGDIARQDEDGYFYILDRKKDMYIVGGYNVYPREIDEVLMEYPKVLEAVAVGVPHGTRGEVIKAYIVPKPGETISKQEIISHCRKKLAVYKVPRLVEIRAELPKSAVGKILRRMLLAEELQHMQAKGELSDPAVAAVAKESASGVMHSTARHVSETEAET